LTGNGEIPEALVITGTAILPRSEDVYVSIVLRDLESVSARVVLKI